MTGAEWAGVIGAIGGTGIISTLGAYLVAARRAASDIARARLSHDGTIAPLLAARIDTVERRLDASEERAAECEEKRRRDREECDAQLRDMDARWERRWDEREARWERQAAEIRRELHEDNP